MNKNRVLDDKSVALIKKRAADLCENWLDQIQEEGEDTNDYNTVLCVYLSACQFLLDKAKSSLEAMGGSLLHYKPDKKDEGN